MVVQFKQRHVLKRSLVSTPRASKAPRQSGQEVFFLPRLASAPAARRDARRLAGEHGPGGLRGHPKWGSQPA